MIENCWGIMKNLDKSVQYNHSDARFVLVIQDKKKDTIVEQIHSFVYQKYDNRQNLLALEVATDQFVVWNTGTHTATPVIVFANGPEKSAFSNIIHHTDVGQKIIEAVLAK